MTERGGQTALYSAAGRGWTRVVAFLVDHGADVDIVDALGKSPLDVALGRVGGRSAPGSEVVAEILRTAGGKSAAAAPEPSPGEIAIEAITIVFAQLESQCAITTADDNGAILR